MSGPLAGVRILDLTRILAGPWATQMLADFGAEVIKIERPQGGDDSRKWGPPFIENGDEAARVSAYFLSANRGKESVAVDISTPEGQEIIRQLAKECDVVVENFKVGGLAKFGLDYASLKAINPKVVYCSITGFGQDGPYANRPSYDFLIQGMGGLMSVTGLPADSPDGGPIKVGVALVDIITGLYACNAILAGLQARARTDEGQHIDIGMLDCMVAVLANQALNYLVTGQSPGRLGNAHPSIVPYDAFPSQDGFIIVAVGNDEQFQRLCAEAGRPDLASDARFATNDARVMHRDVLTPMLSDLFRGRSTEHWLTVLAKAGVPAGPINTMAEVFAEPQVKHRGLRLEMSHPELGLLPGVACPVKFSGTAITYDLPPPTLGQDTRSVLSDRLGWSDDHIEALKRKGVIA